MINLFNEKDSQCCKMNSFSHEKKDVKGMATQQDVIKAFMRSLDNTTLSGAAALDEAIKNCSGGRFSDMQDLIDSFISDVSNHGGSYDFYRGYDEKIDSFLKDYCGIILDNEDTGAITGSDAGAAVTKTADSIVPESGEVQTYPDGGSSTINGLTFHWPDRSTLSSDEQAIVDRLYSWWTKGALDLIQESFGLNFTEAGTSVKDISLSFYNEDDNVLAAVRSSYDMFTGLTEELTLKVNMCYYGGFDQQDVNGAAEEASFYLDRTLAHEFVHAVMAANIDNFANLPLFVKEGLAELVHGIDDEREYSIRDLAVTGNEDYLKSLFSIRGTYYDCGSDTYAGGYMLFRYLAKQAADDVVGSLPEGVYYNETKTAVTITAPFKGIWDAADYVDTVRDIDASQADDSITIKAGRYDSMIEAGRNGGDIYGQGGNDTIYAGAGKDVIWYGNADGEDTVYNFKSGQDVLRFYDNAQLASVATSGNDVILSSASGSVTLMGKANQRVDIVDADGRNRAYYFGRQDKANTFVYGVNKSYYGSAEYEDTLRVNTRANVSLENTTLYHDIDNLDARKSKKAVKLTGGAKVSKLYGSAKNDTLVAGRGGASLIGGKGNDLLYGGIGADKIYWGAGLGNDILYGYDSEMDIIVLSAGRLKSGKASGSDVILTSTSGNTLRIKNAANKEIVVADTKGNVTNKTYSPAGVTYDDDKTTAIIKAPFKGTWDAEAYADTVLTVDASKEIYNITIKAGNNDNTIKAGKKGSNIYGQGGDDIIYGGAGTDVFWYGNGDGADTIHNFQSGKDMLHFYNEAYLDSVATVGTDVVLESDTGSVKLVGKTNQRVDITDADDNTAAYYFGRQDKANTFVYGYSNHYYGSTKYKDTLQIKTGATVSLGNTELYHAIDTLDARRSKKAVKLTGGSKASKLYGSAKNDILKAGRGGASLIGGMGNDKLYGNRGRDKFYWGADLGNDTIYNYASGKDVVIFSAGSLDSGEVSGEDVILTSNTGNTLTIKKAVGKVITIQGTDGEKIEKIYNAPTTTSLPDGVTYDSQNLTLVLSEGTIDEFSLVDNDVVFKSTLGDIRLADTKDKILSVIDGNGVKATYKVAENIPMDSGVSYNDDGTEVILGENTYFDYIFNISNYGEGVHTGNATAYKEGHSLLWGSNGDDVLIAGSGDMDVYGGWGNDTLYGGCGKNDFRWNHNDDNDIVYNYTKGQDRINVYYGRVDGYELSGSDVILKSGKATLTVKDVKPEDITVYNSFSGQYDTYWYDGKLPEGIYYDSNEGQYVVSASFGNENDMFDFHSLPTTTATVDASAVNRPYGFSIWGDERDNTIIASSGGGYIHTGSGSDTVYFGEGEDNLYFDNFYEGEITVYGYQKGQDNIKLGYKDSVSRYEINGNDLVLWNEDQYSSLKLTLKNTMVSDVTILDSDGNEVTNWQETAEVISKSDNLSADKRDTSLYFDDSAAYVDSDSMKLEAVSQNATSLPGQDMAILSSEETSGIGTMPLATGASPMEETAKISACADKSDNPLNRK
ncbi:Hemolysin-type calcium-binding repeat-containing protein [Selenomonas sp. KH1T6]|nr:Hemolysin-type calcium-binding repeat-containing protein [Selenomonas ruminantium]